MKISEKHVSQLRQAFLSMQSKDDLLALLNNCKTILYGDKAFPFELKQITYYSNPAIASKRYTTFVIPKKSGGDRKIHAPVKGLKVIQKCLNLLLQSLYTPHKAASGFILGKSIVDNAKLHIGSNYVLNIDLKDFFPTIDQARIWKRLQFVPFNLNDKHITVERHKPKIKMFTTTEGENIFYTIKEGSIRLIYDKKGNLTRYIERLSISDEEAKRLNLNIIQLEIKNKEIISKDVKSYLPIDVITKSLESESLTRIKIANIIASLCCTEMEVERLNKVTGEWEKIKKNVLPQGAPTSPILTNIICEKLDRRLSGVANRFGLKYSRYADDITFSSQHNVYQKESEFLKELNKIITEQGFHIKKSKYRLQRRGHRQQVTGLIVNDKVNNTNRYIKQIRSWIYLWETYGYERAQELFFKEYISNKGYIKKGRPKLANVVAGKLDYLKMVKGEDNELYKKLRNRYLLLPNPKSEAMETVSISKIQAAQFESATIKDLNTFFPKQNDNSSSLAIVLEILVNEGLEEAMKNYNPK